MYYGLRTALPDIPDEIFGPRFGLIWLLGVNALAGLIGAPVSAATHAEIRALRAGGQRFA